MLVEWRGGSVRRKATARTRVPGQLRRFRTAALVRGLKLPAASQAFPVQPLFRMGPACPRPKIR